MASIVNLFNAMVAVTITLPASASSGARLSTLIAQGTVLTPNADLPSFLKNLSATVDGIGASGSSPLTREIAIKCGQVQIENHAAAFNTDFVSTMPQPVSRANGTAYLTISGLDGVKRTYVRNVANATASVTALCLLMPTAVTDGN